LKKLFFKKLQFEWYIAEPAGLLPILASAGFRG
jgi:hypothetical protein